MSSKCHHGNPHPVIANPNSLLQSERTNKHLIEGKVSEMTVSGVIHLVKELELCCMLCVRTCVMELRLESTSIDNDRSVKQDRFSAN
jgi:hypothetical protein